GRFRRAGRRTPIGARPQGGGGRRDPRPGGGPAARRAGEGRQLPLARRRRERIEAPPCVRFSPPYTCLVPNEAGDSLYDLYRRGISLLESHDYAPAAVPLAKAARMAPEKSSIREALGHASFNR